MPETRNELLEKAEGLGIPVKNYWPKKRILAAIAAKKKLYSINPAEISEIQTEKADLHTTHELENRMMHYAGGPKRPECPKCHSSPSVCMMQRKNYALFR